MQSNCDVSCIFLEDILNTEIYPVTKTLLGFASKRLSAKDRSVLEYLINQVFTDLDHGHSCTDLGGLKYARESIYKILEHSDLVAIVTSIPEHLESKPLTLLKVADKSLLFITKYLQYELNIARQINIFCQVSGMDPSRDRRVRGDGNVLTELQGVHGVPNAEQLAAIKDSLARQLSIITGGPGTGKTTTVMFLLWQFYQLYGNHLKVKICAPTGKAAKRVQESIGNNLSKYGKLLPNCDALMDLTQNHDSFVTIHKLLGSQINNIYFRHNVNNPLDLDILIVDEASMISLPLFSKLIQALSPKRMLHIIFLGDKNQLSSVEEGYVFATLVQNKILAPNNYQYDLLTETRPSIVSDLQASNRNLGDVKALASSILSQNESMFNAIVKNSSSVKLLRPDLQLFLRQIFTAANSELVNYITYIQQNELHHRLDYMNLLQHFNCEIVLCLTNVGLLGTQNVNRQIERRVMQLLGVSTEWYTGRPIIVLENDYALGLSNGDIGFCIIWQGKISIIFDGGREFIPEVLPKYQLAYAITIHKSQGSEYKNVNILLPNDKQMGHIQALLSRELIYTAITRAHHRVNLFADISILLRAIKHVTVRNSGLDVLL